MKIATPVFHFPRAFVHLVAPCVLVGLFTLGCRDREIEIYPTTTTDTFQQPALRKVDILLVVDNSGSMKEEQDKLARNFEAFIQSFAVSAIDYHIGVVTTDLDNQTEAGHLQGDVKIIANQTEDAESIFSENVRVGTRGSGLEMGFEAAKLALSEPLVSTVNAGFSRPTASLSLVFVSDENDMSPGSVDDYLNDFAELKGDAAYRDHSLMNVSALVGDVPYGCQAEDEAGEASAGTRYVDAAVKTEGVYASICSRDFAPIVQALGLDISGLEDEFPLTRCPKTETLNVIVEGRVETQGTAFTFDPDRKSIRFEAPWIPGPAETIEVSYEYHPEDSRTCPDE